jgi:adenylate cyclase
MSEKRTAQQVVDMLNEYFELMVEVIFKYQGTLDKFIGDGLMAIFGAPVPQPDGALRAVRCAHRMMERLAALNARLPPDRQIAIRVGVNSGRVVAGNFGSPERLEYTVLGDTVNVASRLESIADPGTVWVGKHTWEQTRDAFRYEEKGPRQVKGRDAPVEAYELLGPAEPAP